MPLSVLSLLLHLYVGWRLVTPWAGTPAVAVLVAAWLIASWRLLPLALRAPRVRSPRLGSLLVWAGLIALGLFSSLLVLTVLRDAALLASALLAFVWPAAEPVVRLADAGGRVVPLVAALITLWGFLNARRTAAVVSVDVPIRGLCRHCGGRGGTWSERCADCHGTGTRLEAHCVRVTLPPGVADGARIRFRVSSPGVDSVRVEIRIAITNRVIE